MFRNQQVAGSIPAGGSRFLNNFQEINKARPVQIDLLTCSSNRPQAPKLRL
jgi:hypothetical protein